MALLVKVVVPAGTQKALSELTFEDWVEYEWVDVTTDADPERVFVRGRELLPPEQGDMRNRLKDVPLQHRPRTYQTSMGDFTFHGGYTPEGDGMALSMAMASMLHAKPDHQEPAKPVAARPWWRRLLGG